MIRLSDENKFLFTVAAIVALLVTICLISGALFGFCDRREIKRGEANVQNAQTKVEQSVGQVEKAKQEAAETKGEIKVLKEEKEKNDTEVNRKISERRDASDRRERVRRNRLSNVNGTDLKRILDTAERQP